MPDTITPTPIEDHGLIGDIRTAALVGKDGARFELKAGESFLLEVDPPGPPSGFDHDIAEGLFAETRGGNLSEARLRFEKLPGYASPLGLYAEELSPTGLHQGNYPQALTHLALISAASYLSRALERDTPKAWS